MNAIAIPTTRPASQSRIPAVFRLHFANPTTVAWMPLWIYGTIFAINWLIWLIVYFASAPEDRAGIGRGTSWSGASLFIFVWLLVMAVQSMNRTFHLALGFGSTRRDYYLGTALALVLVSAGWAIVFGILGAIEDATNGWGLNGHMFAPIYFGDDGPFARTWYVFLLMLFFTSIGLVAGAAWVRWRTFGVIGFFTIIAFLLIGSIAWITFAGAWAQFGSAMQTLGFAGVYALLLVPTVIAGVVGYLALRRATARS
jgi:hypothetical protein